VLWSVQDYENDAWLVGCAQEPNENCPKDLGPDYDFGAAPILHTLPNGRRVLMVGNKSGQVFTHDPDDGGKLLWKAILVEKIGESEILFGGAADDNAGFFGLDNGSLAAIDPATGQRKWFIPPRPSGPRRGFTAALTAIPGVVFAGNQDGTVRAYASGMGSIVWTFNMLQDFQTVNGVAARGGSMGAPGPTVAGGRLYVPRTRERHPWQRVTGIRFAVVSIRFSGSTQDKCRQFRALCASWFRHGYRSRLAVALDF
jgi:polyvinyl alcohol dehydrogenase (cytochrome)